MSKAPRQGRATAPHETEYDSAEFIVPASDGKGHSQRVQFRLSVSMAREIHVIAASKRFPFLTDDDLLRWCVREGLARLNAMEEVPNSVFMQAEAAIEIARVAIYQQQFQRVFDELTEAMENLRQRGAMNEMRRLYAQVQAKLQAMPGGFWRDLYIDELRRKFGHYVHPRGEKDAAGGTRDRLTLAREDEEQEAAS